MREWDIYNCVIELHIIESAKVGKKIELSKVNSKKRNVEGKGK